MKGVSEEVQIADDDSCATKIRRIGDEIHNLSCRHQNDGDLSGELGSLSFMCWAYSKEVSALQAECEKLRKDAERYRWLRDGNDNKRSVATRIAVDCYGLEWDEAIDAAMQTDNPQRTHQRTKTE